MPSPRAPFVYVLCLAVFTAAACAPRTQEGAPAEKEPVIVGQENLVRVRKEIIQTGPRLSGVLEPRDQSRVRAETGGSVIWEDVELGIRVKQGQVLVRIEDAALRNSLSSAQSALRSARVEHENAGLQLARTQRLVSAGALSTYDLEVAQSAHTAAEARVAQARAQLTLTREQLAYTAVAAPMNGVISENQVNEGDVVAPGTPLFTVIDPSSMRLQASVRSEDLPMLRIGTRVDFEIRGFPGQSFTGFIEQVAPAVDPNTRQITTLVGLPNPGGKLLAGLFAEGRISARAKEALVVPLTAVDQTAAAPAVLRVEDGKVARITVTLGLRDPQTERVEIQGPVNEGDLLLTGAAMELAPGTPVKITGAGHAMNP